MNSKIAKQTDCIAKQKRLPALSPQKTLVWPDGGVVTQRIANPLTPPEKPQYFAQFTLCSSHVVPLSRIHDCETPGAA